MAEKPPSKLTLPGNFEMLKKAGNGIFGKVYHVRERKPPHKEYALKQIYNRYDRNKIDNEIKALELLNRYHIGLKLHSVIRSSKSVSLLLEYSHGNNLIRHVKKHGPLAENEMTSLLTDILEMLKFMQKNEILHLDIKPTNILCHGAKYLLIDWGLCKWGTSARTIRLNGNPIYFPPEMYYGERNIASEIYSLGCVLYFVLTGKEIYGLDYHKPLCQKIYSHIMLNPEFPEGLSKKFQYIASRMLEKDSRRRITISDIEDILKGNDIIIKTPAPDPNISIDFSEEIKVFHLLADKGVPYAQHLLAKYYQKGEMVEQDLQLAFDLNRSAAQFGLAKAQYDLAIAYRDGKGVEQDANKAFNLFSRAARQGHELSQFALAEMFAQGIGTSRVESVAKYWFEQAALNGHKKAMEKFKI